LLLSLDPNAHIAVFVVDEFCCDDGFFVDDAVNENDAPFRVGL
jgi:hypothetical protein